MMSRLNQLNNRVAPRVVDGGAPRVSRAALGYWVPSSPMPRTAFHKPDHRQPPAPDQSVLGQGLDGVLTAGRLEPARGQAQRRDGVSIELDEEDRDAGHQRRDLFDA